MCKIHQNDGTCLGMQPPFAIYVLSSCAQLLERRDKETAGSNIQTKCDRMRYRTRLFRVLADVLVAAAPVACSSATTAATVFRGTRAAGSAAVPARRSLVKLSQRMAWLAAGGCIAVHQDFARAEGQAEFSAEGLLRSRADVRQSLQASLSAPGSYLPSGSYPGYTSDCCRIRRLETFVSCGRC